METNERNEYLQREFYKLHRSLVTQVIKFCQENFIDADEFSLNADGLKVSINYGEWTPATDSSFILEKDGEKDPVLFSM